MIRYDQPQIEALRWALDKLDEQFAKARQARAQVPDLEEDDEGEDHPGCTGRGYFDENDNEETT